MLEKACGKEPCLSWDPGSGFQAEGEVSAKMEKTGKARHIPECVWPECRARSAEEGPGWKRGSTIRPLLPTRPGSRPPGKVRRFLQAPS